MKTTLKTWCAAALLGSAAVAALAHGYTAGALKIGHPWARATVAGQATGGAYLKLENTGSTPDRLLGGSTPAAERVELHSMSMEGNVMRMREVPAIDIPAGQTVELKPGQFHLMLVGLKAPLAADAKIPLTLKFEKAGEVKVEVKVESMVPGSAASGGGHQH
ncbi:copper chaperone PCu(A)C [Ideonella sp. BN130291]|uniref:copper chaperone PCu(A)C n=1 Tax=Ideonella sp. BN130291 TaxID=3112940 RepID=UPI002E25C446|nr:copper chaperone PCu(A)C [Ideonella sp. BN130291]